MGNCWIHQTDCTGNTHNTGRLLQSNSNSTSLGLSNHFARRNKLFGPSNTNASPLASENSQTLQARGEDDVTNHGLTLDVADSRVFTLAELKKATKGFRANTLLGQGGFSRVYKGRLKEREASSCRDDGLVIAIKRLNSDSKQGVAEWQSIVNFLGRLRHPNLVRLLGYGRENSEWFLVYEFMQQGSLDKQLFGTSSKDQPLSWDIRLKVMTGAARGLAFLHSLETKIIYRDFKLSNILLDKAYTAKLSDFGFATFGPAPNQTQISSTQVEGTHGYTAPENIATDNLHKFHSSNYSFLSRGEVGVKSDVYGFGIVVVEILSGKTIGDIMKFCGQNQTLVDWLKSITLNRMKMRSLLMDARLRGKYPSKLAVRVAQLALKCIQTDPKLRPSIEEVAETLQHIEAVNCERPSHNNTKRPSHSRATQDHGRPDGG